MNTLHGLPQDVIYCKKCVMSNQRPSTSAEFKKNSTRITTAGFYEDGVCHTCRYFEYKKSINWDDRERQLRELCDLYRRNDGQYDVIIPGSGGKDSIFVSHILKHKYHMNPLTVTWAPHMYTEVGWKNMENWLQAGFDNILVTPNPEIHRTLTKLAFENLVNPFQPFIIGQKNVAPRLAKQYGIKLIMYGENQAECHNSFEENQTPLMDPSHFTIQSTSEPLFFGGVSLGDLKDYGLAKNDMYQYFPLLRDEFEQHGIEIHYMSYYVNWSPQANYYYAKQYAGFESNPDGRSEGTYSKFASLDDKLDGQHYYTMYIKFGQGRAMNDACRDIRDGIISREEGVALVSRYDGEFPKKYFLDVLHYMKIDEERYGEIIDGARSPHLWKKEHNKWVLRHPLV